MGGFEDRAGPRGGAKARGGAMFAFGLYTIVTTPPTWTEGERDRGKGGGETEGRRGSDGERGSYGERERETKGEGETERGRYYYTEYC